MAVWNLTEGLGLISVFIKVFEGNDKRGWRTGKKMGKGL